MVPYQNPTIYIGSIRIDEPITVLTDLLIVGVGVFSFFKTQTQNQTTDIKLYRWFLLMMGLSTLISAIFGHAFLYSFSFNAKIFGWVTTVLTIAFGQLASVFHTQSVFSKQKRNALIGVIALENIIAITAVFIVFSFVIVEVHSAIGLLLNITLLEAIYFKQKKSVLSRNMILGVSIAVLAIVCHIFKLAISVWFNHMDLSHVIIAIALYVMHLGIYKEIKENNIKTITSL